MSGDGTAMPDEEAPVAAPLRGGPEGGVAPGGEQEVRSYLAQVMAEIDGEVRRRRASGDLPARTERELDELFLEFSPVAGRGGLSEALRMVDAAAFIDPVVPIASAKSGGALVKKGLRSLSLWYVGYVTHQVSQFTSAAARAFHQVDDQLATVRAAVDAARLPPAPVVDPPELHHREAWWVEPLIAALAPFSRPGSPGASETTPKGRRTASRPRGRVLHAASGDGWLVEHLATRGLDAYGVDPRPASSEGGRPADRREEGLVEHLGAVEPASLSAVVLSGVVEGMSHGERDHLLELLTDRLAPEGVLALHSLSRGRWESPDAPAAADLAPGRPLRPGTWEHLLRAEGFAVTIHLDPAGGPEPGDYLVVATPAGGARPLR